MGAIDEDPDREGGAGEVGARKERAAGDWTGWSSIERPSRALARKFTLWSCPLGLSSRPSIMLKIAGVG